MGDAALRSWLAERGLRIEQREGRGRCLVASRAFGEGAAERELLLEQQPYAVVPLDESAACDACGRVSDAGAAALKRCTRCRVARYCSTDCQRAAWQRGTHARECAALAALHASQRRVPPPSLRLLHRMLLKRDTQRAAAATSPPPPWDAPELLDALVTHRVDASADAVLAAAQMATLLASFAGDAPPADPDADDVANAARAAAVEAQPWRLRADVAELTCLLLALSCNAHSVCDAELRPLGRGLYPLIAAANHACAPSAALTFRGWSAQLRALRGVGEGEEVTLAYADVAVPAAARRAELRRGYYFDCACDRCAAALAPGGSDDDKALGGVACEACGAALPVGAESAACGACGVATQPLPARAAALAAATAAVEAQLEAVKAARAAGDVAAARHAANAAVSSASAARSAKTLPATAAVRTRALDETLRCAIDAADWAGALEAAEAALPGYERAHAYHHARDGHNNASSAQAPRSPLLGLHYATLGRLRWAAEDAAGAAAAYERALFHLRASHGRDAPLVQELAQSSREAQAAAAHTARAAQLE